MNKILHILILIIFFSPAFAQRTVHLQSKETSFTILKQSTNSFEFEAKVAEVISVEKKTDLGTFSQIQIKGYSGTNTIGAPRLPVMTRLIEVPEKSGFTIEIKSYDQELIKLYDFGINNKLYPAQPPAPKSIDPDKRPLQYNSAAYQKDEYSQREMVTLEYLGTMRGKKLARLTIQPFEYNPVRNALKVHNNLIAEISFSNNSKSIKGQLNPAQYSPYFDHKLSPVLQAVPTSSMSKAQEGPITYVIVSHPMFEESLQPFIEWKTKMGFRIIEAYTGTSEVGTTTTSIKNYLKDLYINATPEQPAPTFGLIVGDHQQIPAFSGSATIDSHVSDLYYFEYDGGSDYFPEVFYGRFSAKNVGQLTPQIAKTLEYEKYEFENSSYLNEVLLVSGVDGAYAPTYGNGQINYGTKYYFNTDNDFIPHTYLYPTSGSSSSAIFQHLSRGVGFANYTAHCSSSGWANPNFDISDISSLQNYNKYIFMIGNCCQSNKFQYDCFGEAILQVPGKGAIGYIGGSNDTFWEEDYWWAVGAGSIRSNPTYEETGLGMYDRLFHTHNEPETVWVNTQGQILAGGNLSVAASSSPDVRYYWEIYHLMGDPSLTPHFKEPEMLLAEHTSTILIGARQFEVKTEEGAYVGLSRDGKIVQAAYANNNGIATLNFDPFISVGKADIVVSRKDRIPYVTQVDIIPANGPYVVLHQHATNDASGNRNNLIDDDEIVSIEVGLKNVGTVAASNVEVSILSTDPYIEIIKPIQYMGNIAPNELVNSPSEAFKFYVKDSIPDQHETDIEVIITDETKEPWHSKITVTLNAPSVDIKFHRVVDELGDNNYRLDPGEEVELWGYAKNNGHAPSLSGGCSITAMSSYIDLLSSHVELPLIQPNDSVFFFFTAKLDSASPIGTPVPLQLDYKAGKYQAYKDFEKKIGLIVEDWENANFNSFKWSFSGKAVWTISSQNPAEGNFCVKTGSMGNYSSTILKLDFYSMRDDEISFMKKVSSEAEYDYLSFYIDGALMGKWAGEIDWSEETFPVAKGEHTVYWEYEKDASMTGGSDCVWLDFIVLPLVDLTGNKLPEFSTVPNSIVNEMQEYIYEFEVNDPDANDILHIEIQQLPSWLTYTNTGNGTGLLQGIPTSLDIGINPVEIRVFDGIAYAAQSFNIGVGLEVENWESNSFSSYFWEHDGNRNWYIDENEKYDGRYSVRSGNLRGNQRSDLILTVNVVKDGEISFYVKTSSEYDYDELRFYIDSERQGTWSGETDWTKITFPVKAGERKFHWRYSKDYATSEGMDCAWIDFIVLPVVDLGRNYPPVFQSIPPEYATEESDYNYDIIVKDFNTDDEIVIDCPILPDWLTFVSGTNGTATLSGIPSSEDISNYNLVILTATDNVNAEFVRQEFEITVLNTNDPPIFASVPDTICSEDEIYNYHIAIKDEDPNDNLSIYFEGPDWLGFIDNGNGTAILTGIPADQQIGTHAISVFATDGFISNPIRQDFKLQVSNINDTPRFLSIAKTEGFDDIEYSYEIEVVDPDPDASLEYFGVLPDWLTLTVDGDGNALLKGTPTDDFIGSNNVSISVSDGIIANPVSQTFSIEVVDLNDPPEFISDPKTEAVIDMNYIYTILVKDNDINSKVELNCTDKPEWLTFSPNEQGAILSGMPTESDLGKHSIEIQANDGILPNPIIQQFTIQVLRENSVSAISGLKDFRVYPNPASDYAVLEFTLQHPTQTTIQLFGLLGNSIQTSTIRNQEPGLQQIRLNTKALEPGSYLISLVNSETKKIKKLIIQH